QPDERRDDGNGNAEDNEGDRRERDVDRALHEGVDALETGLVDVDDRHAVEVLEPRAERDHLQDVRYDLDVDAFTAGDIQQLEQPDVLFRRKRDVEVFDRFADGDVGRLIDGPEQGQAAVSEVIAGRAIVDEPGNLIPQLAVLDDLVRDQSPQFA